MMCSIHIDESTTNINYYVAVTSLGTFFSEKLNHLHAPRTTHGSRNDALKWALRSQGNVNYCDGVAPSGL
jgi:hypothetical protein